MTDRGWLVRTRRMRLYAVGHPVDREELLHRAGIVPRAVTVERWRRDKLSKSGRYVTEDRWTDPWLQLLYAEEGMWTLPETAWTMVLRVLNEGARRALEAGVRWTRLMPGWSAEELVDLEKQMGPRDRWSRGPRAAEVTKLPRDEQLDDLLDDLFD